MNDHCEVSYSQGEIKRVDNRGFISFRHGIHAPAVLEHKCIGAESAGQGIIAESTVEHVIAFTTGQDIRAFITPEDVIERITCQGIIMD